MYSLERQLWYWHLLTRHCPCNLLPEQTSPKHEYREKFWGHPVTSSMTSSPQKNFFCIIRDDLFISEVRLKLSLIFKNFKNGGHFELATNFFTESYTGSWIYQKDSHEHFGHFELLIDALTEMLTEIYQFQIWPILWPGDVINDVMNIYLYNCSHNLLIHMHRNFNDDIFARFLVIMKNVISFIKEYRGTILRPPCDVMDNVIFVKILFLT